MSDHFFDRLFSGSIRWALHTAMTCDLAYVGALIKKQQGDQLSYNTELNCAFFYDGKKSGGLTCKINSPGFSAGKLEKYIHRLDPQTTHHAKISLVYYEKGDGTDGFRLAVYSRNLEFSGSMDTALLFELEPTSSETDSGRRLCAYLEKLCDIAEESGKEWLARNVRPQLDLLGQCTLKSEFGGKEAQLYFGGVGNGINLGALLGLANATNDSIVLTPPAFIKETGAQEFFAKRKPVLYDSKKGASHIKLYLLEKPENVRELWVGSANATSRGLGWDLSKGAAVPANIECLVKFDIGADEFDALKKEIAQRYYQYADFGIAGSLVVHPDNIGPYIVQNFRCAEIKYSEPAYANQGTITVTLEKTGTAPPPAGEAKVPWRPLEYSKTVVSEPINFNCKQITLTYSYAEFRKSQGRLVFGSSCRVMAIDKDKLPNNLPMQRDKPVKDTRLSDWLVQTPENIPDANDKWDDELKWLRGVLCDPAPPQQLALAAPSASWPSASGAVAEEKAAPMGFQKNGANRLNEILEKHSRAFLADEPGLGKTFTSALLINKLAEKKDEGPFFVLYIAPNLALLESNGKELVDKFNAVSTGKNAVLLSDLSPKNALKAAYKLYYTEKINAEKTNEKKAFFRNRLQGIIGKIDEHFHYQKGSHTNIRTYTKSFVDQIRIPYKENNRIMHVPAWNGQNGLLQYYNKTHMPDRLAFAYETLEPVGSAELKDNVVIITVSAEVALGGALAEEELTVFSRCGMQNRTEFTEFFLRKYCPDLIIWDEFHRYINKLNTDNPFFAAEAEAGSSLKSLFVSATPYKTNISGDENKIALEQLYQGSLDLDEESEDVKLPSFEKDFVPLFCGGTPALSQKAVIGAYNKLLGGDKSGLEPLLKERMIRNERTRLQGYYEEHIPLSEPAAQYDASHAVILKNTYEQCRLLKEAGYQPGALRWSLSLPWVLCFSTKYTNEKSRNNDRYFALLHPTKTVHDEKLFVYKDDDTPKKELLRLPEHSLAMHQICEHNIPDRDAAQLLWMPATMPLYQAGEESIFTKHSGYSKLLVFAEYRYLQRGGALLLSDYCRLLYKCAPIPDSFPPALKYDGFGSACFPTGDRSDRTLDELLKEMPGDDTEMPDDDMVTKLYRLASPAACAEGLGLDPEALTDAFHEYFGKPGVREALWSWLCKNKFSDESKWEEGILRYCAEGNLYAVLKEWLFCMKEKTAGEQMEHIYQVLSRQTSRVGVQTHATAAGKNDGKPRPCGFAEQLTSDVNDNGSGAGEQTAGRIGDCCKAFNSPFYPMILFAGRGAQEGIDLHNYCLRIMHLTLPRGAVSYEQRNGRIDRYRSLLVRRRAAELVGTNAAKELAGAFKALQNYSDNKLYPNWSIPNGDSKWHFEELMPVWEYTEESCFADTVREMLRTYRESMGVHNKSDSSHIDLSTV